MTSDPLREALATELWGRFGWGSDRSRQTAETLADPGAAYWFEEAAAVLAALSTTPAPLDDMPDHLTVNGHLFVHVAACPCPRIQSEVARLAERDDYEWDDNHERHDEPDK